MIGVLIFTLTGFVFGVLLVGLDNHFKSCDDKILKRLPGYNCGMCGFGSCEGMKEKILEDKENYKRCKFINDSETIKYFSNLK